MRWHHSQCAGAILNALAPFSMRWRHSRCPGAILDALTSFSMRWRHSWCVDVILNTLTPFPTGRCHSVTFLRKILGIFCRRVIDVWIINGRSLWINTSMTRLQNILRIFQRKNPEWQRRVGNGVSVLRMTSAHREWRQRIKNDVSISGLMLFRFRFAVASVPKRVEWMTSLFVWRFILWLYHGLPTRFLNFDLEAEIQGTPRGQKWPKKFFPTSIFLW